MPNATAISLLVLARETRLKILLSAVVSLEMSVFTAIALFSVLITGTEANPVRLLSSFSFGDILGIAFLAHVSVRARLLLDLLG